MRNTKKGSTHLLLERQIKYEFIKTHSTLYSVEKMCKLYKISRRAYYTWLVKPISKREQRREALKVDINRIYYNSKCRYGSPRITKELNQEGIIASKILVAKLMRELGLKSIIRRKYKITTDSSHKYPVALNVLDRMFAVAESNMAWVSDLTYISTKEGWLYLTTVIDLFDRKVIGWAMSETMQTIDTTLSAFKMAKINQPILNHQKLIFHSDRGIQYASEEFTKELDKHKNITRSMSRKGNCWDNAVAESFFKTLKTELIYHHIYQTKQEAQLSIYEYIETFYNTKRRHSHLKNLSIIEHNNLINNNLKNAA